MCALFDAASLGLSHVNPTFFYRRYQRDLQVDPPVKLMVGYSSVSSSDVGIASGIYENRCFLPTDKFYTGWPLNGCSFHSSPSNDSLCSKRTVYRHLSNVSLYHGRARHCVSNLYHICFRAFGLELGIYLDGRLDDNLISS